MANKEASDGGPLLLPGSGIVHSCTLCALFSGQTAASSASASAQLWVKQCTIFMIARNISSSIIISGDFINWSLLLTGAVRTFTTSVLHYSTERLKINAFIIHCKKLAENAIK